MTSDGGGRWDDWFWRERCPGCRCEGAGDPFGFGYEVEFQPRSNASAAGISIIASLARVHCAPDGRRSSSTTATGDCTSSLATIRLKNSVSIPPPVSSSGHLSCSIAAYAPTLACYCAAASGRPRRDVRSRPNEPARGAAVAQAAWVAMAAWVRLSCSPSVSTTQALTTSGAHPLRLCLRRTQKLTSQNSG